MCSFGDIFDIFQFNHISAYLSIENLVAYVVALFLASVRYCLKKLL